MAASASFVKLSNEELEKVWGKGNDSKGLKIVIKRFIPRFIFMLYTAILIIIGFFGLSFFESQVYNLIFFPGRLFWFINIFFIILLLLSFSILVSD